MVTVLSQVTGLPAAFIRKAAKTYGTCRYAEGTSLSGKNVVLIEDVVSSGGAILEALQKFRAEGIEPLCAICVIDRQTGGSEALQAADLELKSVLTMQDIQDAGSIEE